MSKSSLRLKMKFDFVVCLALVVVSIGSVGCSTLRLFEEQAALTYRDFVWGRRAYNLRYTGETHPYEDHFRSGFCAGYQDVCQGGDGYVPALPPDSYRGYEFQSADGAKCVEAWFDGYPEGVAAARQDKSGAFSNIVTSKTIDEAIRQNKESIESPVSVLEREPTGNISSGRADWSTDSGQSVLSVDASRKVPATNASQTLERSDAGSFYNSVTTP